MDELQPTNYAESDAALVAAFAARNRVDVDTLVAMLVGSLAEQLRAGKPVPLPVPVGLPAMQCFHCPFGAEAGVWMPPEAARKVVRGPW